MAQDVNLQGNEVFSGITKKDKVIVASSVPSINDWFADKNIKLRQDKGRIPQEEADVLSTVATCKGTERINSNNP